MCQDCAGLSSPAVKNAIRSSRPNAPATTRESPEAPTPISSRMTSASSSSSSDSSASIREETATAAAPWAAAWSATAAGTSSSPSSTLATNSTGLPVSGPRLRMACGASSGTGHGAHRAGPPAAPRSPAQPRLLGRPRRDRRRAPRGPPAHGGAPPARGRRRSARSRSISMSAAGSTRPSGWITLASLWRADHVQQRVGLADVAEELVAEPLALVRALDEPGDVVELDRVRARCSTRRRSAPPRRAARRRPARPPRWARSS